jgi:hypothetical protein
MAFFKYAYLPGAKGSEILQDLVTLCTGASINLSASCDRSRTIFYCSDSPGWEQYDYVASDGSYILWDKSVTSPKMVRFSLNASRPTSSGILGGDIGFSAGACWNKDTKAGKWVTAPISTIRPIWSADAGGEVLMAASPDFLVMSTKLYSDPYNLGSAITQFNAPLVLATRNPDELWESGSNTYPVAVIAYLDSLLSANITIGGFRSPDIRLAYGVSSSYATYAVYSEAYYELNRLSAGIGVQMARDANFNPTHQLLDIHLRGVDQLKYLRLGGTVKNMFFTTSEVREGESKPSVPQTIMDSSSMVYWIFSCQVPPAKNNQWVSLAVPVGASSKILDKSIVPK